MHIKNLEIKRVPHGGDIYLETIKLRDEILRKPLGLQFTQSQLDAENNDFHLVAHDDGRLVGCLILSPQENGHLRMRQVAVQLNIQKQGVGTALVNFSEQFASKEGFSTMMLHARKEAVPFYLRLGYTIFDEPFFEVGIEHRKMKKAIEVHKLL